MEWITVTEVSNQWSDVIKTLVKNRLCESCGYLTLRQLMSYIYIYIYIYGAPIVYVSRSHTTTHHSR